jgi:hypothetical protein
MHRVDVDLSTEAALEGRLLSSQAQQSAAGAIETSGFAGRQPARSLGRRAPDPDVEYSGQSEPLDNSDPIHGR